jgi:hypothetical protein
MHEAYIRLEYHIALGFFIGFIGLYLLRKNLNSFIPLILVVNIFGNGPQVVGYFFYDEFLSILFSLFFLLFNILDKGISSIIEPLKKIPKGYLLLLSIFIIYMSAQSIRGIFVNDDLRIIRWVIFYLGLVPIWYSIYIAIYRAQPTPIEISSYILFSSLAYLFLYLFIGIYFDNNYASQFSSQNYFWSGTSYAFYPILIALIANYTLLRKKQENNKKFFGFILFLLLVFMSMYFDSRLIQISSLIFALSFLISKQFRTTLVLLAIYSTVVSGYISFQYLNASKINIDDSSITNVVPANLIQTKVSHQETESESKHYPENNYQQSLIEKDWVFEPDNTVDALKTYVAHNIIGSFSILSSNSSDFTRDLQFIASIEILSNGNIFDKLFGFGFYRHKYLLVDLMQNYFLKNYEKISISEQASLADDSRSDLNDINKINVYRTNSFNGIIIDTGLIGVSLIILILTMSIMTLLTTRIENKYQASLFVMISFFWLFFSNITDIYLFYIILLPGFFGLILGHKKDIY